MIRKFTRAIVFLITVAMLLLNVNIGAHGVELTAVLASQTEPMLEIDCTTKLLFAGWNSGNAGGSYLDETEDANVLSGSWAMLKTNIVDFQRVKTIRVLIKSASGNDILSHQFSFTSVSDGDCSNGFEHIADNYNAYISGSEYKWIDIPIKHLDTTSTEGRLWIQADVYVKKIQVFPEGYVSEEDLSKPLLDVDCSKGLTFAGWNSGNVGKCYFDAAEGANVLKGSWAMLSVNIPNFQNAGTVRVLMKSASGNDILSHQFSFTSVSDGDCSNGFDRVADNYQTYISGNEYKWVNVPIKRLDTTSTEGRLWIQADVYVKKIQVLPEGYVVDEPVSLTEPLLEADCSNTLMFAGWNSGNVGRCYVDATEGANVLDGTWAMFGINIPKFQNVGTVRILMKGVDGKTSPAHAIVFTETSDGDCSNGLNRVAENYYVYVTGNEYTWVEVPVRPTDTITTEGRLWIEAGAYVKKIQVLPRGYMSGEETEEIIYNVCSDQVAIFFEDAKEAYGDGKDYTESIVANYAGGISKRTDRPKPISLYWPAVEDCSDYTLTITETETGKNRTFKGITTNYFDVYNLKADTSYYWQVTGGGETSEKYTFCTANTPRYMRIDNISNVRDIGGWNGLNQGLVFRGGYMDYPTDNGIGHITEAGKAEMLELGIKTEIDFRNTSEIKQYKSAISDDVRWLNYTTQYAGDGNEIYRRTLLEFSDIDSYPIYMHCVGGADRTGSMAFMLEAICGCSERDISIDYELTSFSIWDLRERNSDKFRNDFLNKTAELEGDTFKEKYENYFMNDLKLSRAHISNIRSILAGNGVVFAEPKDLYYGDTVNVPLKNMGNHTVESVTVNGEAVDFVVSGNVVSFKPGEIGTGEIVFEDAGVLPFDTKKILVSSFPENEGVSADVNADVVLTFTDSPDMDTFNTETVKINGSSDLIEGFSYDEVNAPNSVTINIKPLEHGKRYFVELKGVKVGEVTNVHEITAFTTPFSKTVSKLDFEDENLKTYFNWGGNYENIELKDGAFHITKPSELQTYAFLYTDTVNTDDVDFIRIKIKSNGNIRPKYYFTTNASQDGYSEDKAIMAEAVTSAEDDYKIVDLKISDNASWNGLLTGSRIDIVGDATEIYIDEISFYKHFPGADGSQTEYFLGEHSMLNNMSTENEENITDIGIKKGNVTAFLGGFHNNTNADVDICLVNALYEHGKLMQISYNSATIGAFDSLQAPLGATLVDVPEYSEGLEIKSFLWNGTQNPMKKSIIIGEPDS